MYGLLTDLPDGAVLEEVDKEDVSGSAQMPAVGFDRDIQMQLDLASNGSHRSTFHEKRKEKVMYVCLPDDYQFGTISPEQMTSSPMLSATYVADDQHGDSPVAEAETMVRCVVADDIDTPAAGSTEITRQVARRSSTSLHQSSAAHLPLFRRRRTRRRVPVNSSFITVATKNIDNGDTSVSNGGTPSFSTSGSSHYFSVTTTSSSPVSRPMATDAAVPSSAVLPQCSTPKRQTEDRLKELLASIPGFSLRRRKCSCQKLSIAAQIRQTCDGCIDLETPNSILVNTDLRALIGQHTFKLLPAAHQYQLIQLLPECDHVQMHDGQLRIGTNALSNEFLTNACNEWRRRLSEGEFTQKNQVRLKHEEEKQQSRVDEWKIKHFETTWGQKDDDVKVDSISLLAAAADVIASPNIASCFDIHDTPVTVRTRPTRAKLVSTMLQQRSISHNVAASQVLTCHVAMTDAQESSTKDKTDVSSVPQSSLATVQLASQPLTSVSTSEEIATHASSAIPGKLTNVQRSCSSV